MSTPARSARLALPFAVLLGLSACGSAPPKVRPLPDLSIPANWAAADAMPGTGSAGLAAWWLRLGDSSLTSLVAQALQANTTVASAQAALRQARALRDVTAAGLLPGVTGSASARHGTAGGHSTGNVFAAGLDASWELDVFGARRSARDAGDADAAASAATLGDVQVSVAAEVALAYITLRSTQARLAIADTNLASQRETLQIAQWRLQAGLITTLDTEQARAAAEQTAAQRPALQTGIDQSRHALALLIGQPPAALDARLDTAEPLPQAADDLALALPAQTLRQRPDVRAAEWQVSAALARVAQADAARAPNFNLGGSLGLSALSLGTLANSASVVSSLLAGVSLPVFDGGAGRAQVRAQQAAWDSARFAYHAAVLGALRDVEDALVALRGDRERVARLQAAAAAATNAATLARQRYDGGVADFQTVLETQRTQLATQDSVALAAADLVADHVRLYKALGGGWQPDGERDPNDLSTPLAARTSRR